MSTLIGRQNLDVIHSENELLDYFLSACKPESARQIGVEAEFLGVCSVTGKALPYDGPYGIEAILIYLSQHFHYQKILDRGRVIGLQRSDAVIALEPGGQIELSAPPVIHLREMQDQLRVFLKELCEVQQAIPEIRWLSYGIHPFSGLDDIAWVPKERYEIMARHFQTRGALSHHMMKRTATNQFNFDYTSEADAMDMFRTALGITSIASALFANAGFSMGAPNGFASERLKIWQETDPDRTGLLTHFLQPGKTFKDYLKYLLDMPMIFSVRDDKWIPLNGIRFAEFLRRGFEGLQATWSDFELHLSTAFPEVRFKKYMEIRGMDAQPSAMIPSLAAFWKGILYDRAARAEAWKLVSFASERDHELLHEEIPRKGLSSQLGGQPVFPIARQLVDIAEAGLENLSGQKASDESVLIDPIRKHILESKKTPSEMLVEKWNADFAQDKQRLLNYLKVCSC